jgi:hypothetical protein
MGQYWRLINLDKLQDFPLPGTKLGEFFWSYRDNIIYILTKNPKMPDDHYGELTLGAQCAEFEVMFREK